MNSESRRRYNLGFTLVEIMVTVAIVTILISTAILNYFSFNDRLSLSSAGQEMAINIRLTQSYGLNVKETSPGASDFTKAYGIYFDMDTGDNDEYIIFADLNSDKKYDEGSGCGTGGGTECVELVKIDNRVTISLVDAIGSCPSLNAARSLNIIFLRPNPDAEINFLNNGGNSVCYPSPNAVITLTSKGGRVSTLTVEATGQISVQ